MSEPFLTDQVVSVDSWIDIRFVNTDSNTHDHMLGPFHDFVVNLQQVGFLEGLEPEIIII